MASAVPPPRHLALTVGPAAVLDGVKVRTGNYIDTGERVVSGLVQRFDIWDYVSDNAGNFRRKAPPRNGIFINLCAHKVYVGIDTSCVYPHRVIEAGETPLCATNGPRGVRLVGSVEVMMTAPTPAAGARAGPSRDPTTGGQVTTKQAAPQPTEVDPPATKSAEVQEVTPKAARVRWPPLERPENILQATVDNVTTPVAPMLDLANAQEELEETR